ncbi:MAG: MFS transporter [Sporolactobacillus sp.]
MAQTKQKLFLATFVNYLAIFVTMPVLVPLCRTAFLSPGQTGLMVSVGSLSMMLGGPVWGKLSDRWGRKIVIVSGMLAVGIVYILYIALFGYAIAQGKFLITAFVYLVLSRILLGIFLPAMPAAGNALMADLTDEASRTKGMALLGFAMGLAMVIGPAIGGLLSGAGSLFYPFYLTVALSLVIGLYLIHALPSTPPSVAQHRDQVKKSPFFSFQLLSWLLLGCSSMLIMVMIQMLIPLLLHDVFHYSTIASASQSAILFFIMGLVLIGTQVLQMKRLNWQPVRLISLGALFMIVALPIIAITANYWLLVASFLFIGAGLAFGMTAMAAGCSLSVPKEHQGIVSGLVAMTQGISGVVSPIVSTLLYEQNHSLPFFVFLGFTICAFIVFLINQALQKRASVIQS